MATRPRMPWRAAPARLVWIVCALALFAACGDAAQPATGATPRALILAHSVPNATCTYPADLNAQARWSGTLDLAVRDRFDAHLVVENTADTLVAFNSATIRRKLLVPDRLLDDNPAVFQDLFGFTEDTDTIDIDQSLARPGERVNISLPLWTQAHTEALALDTLGYQITFETLFEVVLTGRTSDGAAVQTNTFALPLELVHGGLLKHRVDFAGSAYWDITDWAACVPYLNDATNPDDTEIDAPKHPSSDWNPASTCAPGQDLELDTCACFAEFVAYTFDEDSNYITLSGDQSDNLRQARESCFGGFYRGEGRWMYE